MIPATNTLERYAPLPPSPPRRPLARRDGGHAVALIRPPYDRAEYQAGWSAVELRPTPPGLVLGVSVEEPLDDYHTLDRTIRELRERSPGTPVVLLLNLGSEESLFVAAHAMRRGVRAVVPSGAPLRESLRRSLTGSTALGEDVVEWLALCGLRLSPLVASLVLQIVTLAPRHPSLTGLLDEVGVPETSARFRMNKKRLPPPSRWYQAARALYAALRIQAEPESCLLRLAHGLGYADHSALSQLVYRSFGVRPGVVRGTLGWEWLMDRWIRRHRLAPALRLPAVRPA